MKRPIIVISIVLSVMAGCGGGNRQSTENLITVDITANYPEKELILQDIMDVEYIPLETTDEFLTKGVVKAVGREVLLVTNQGDGDIFVYDRTGKGLRKINRMGQGGEEYTQATEIILDEENNEMFVKDHPARKILIYDLFGNYRRSFKFADTGYYNFIFNYDPDNLICYKSYSPIDNDQSGHLLISKQDGRVIRKIDIPFDEIKTPIVIDGELHVTPMFFLTYHIKIHDV